MMDLDSFDPGLRKAALLRLVAAQPPASPRGENVNLHIHSFYSFNAEGWSPTRTAWETRRMGLYAAGMCDFDVLDGLEEFLDTGLDLEHRVCVHLETRAYVAALGGQDINSPGEHGVAYVMGAGFGEVPAQDQAARGVLDRLRATACERNLALVSRMAQAFPKHTLDYDRDVLPLTPAGVATERHIIRAFADKARARGPLFETELLTELLTGTGQDVDRLRTDRVALEEALRTRLVKRGGLAYRPPDTTAFPPLADFFAWVRACGAIPMAAWLDGTSPGEADADTFLDVMAEAGASAVNIIPDRNWNVKDHTDRERRIGNLRAMVGAAARRGFPINIGTEMNRAGLPAVDDLEGQVLSEHRETFLRGARLMIGQSILRRYAGYGYAGEKACADHPSVPERNGFFECVGSLPPLGLANARALRDGGAARALATIRDAVAAGRWPGE